MDMKHTKLIERIAGRMLGASGINWRFDKSWRDLGHMLEISTVIINSIADEMGAK
tara:strand:+ start:32 stop:196 length:165 start_codon:yes stop_codon:yes gene_type:complete